MTKIEEQALKVARTWKLYSDIDRRLADDRERARVSGPCRDSAARDQDARDVRPATAAYKKELDILTQMML